MPSDSRSNSDSPFPRFERVMKALIQVPKKEIEKMATREHRKRSRKRAPKSA
jgi:hypothetical protein